MAQHTWVLTLVMGGLLAAVFVAVLRGRKWRHYAPTVAVEGPGTITAAVRSPSSWILLYLGIALVVGGAAVVLSSGGAMVSVGAGTVWSLLRLGFAVLVVGYVVLGTYFMLRSRGRSSAQAAGLSVLLLGGLFLLFLVLRLAGIV